MYSHLRNYIWGFETVQRLADLEIAVYSSFPDLSQIQSSFRSLYNDIREVLSEDEELAEAVNAFKQLIETIENNFYLKLDKVQEAI